MNPTRRDWLTSCGAAASGCLALGPSQAADSAPARTRLGIVNHSFPIRLSDPGRRLGDPLTFLQYVYSLGAGGMQTSLGMPSEEQASKIRQFLETHALSLEGSIGLPKSPAGVDRFAAEVKAAKRCGASILRTVLSGGRRYEVFEKPEDFKKFHDQAARALALARPIVEKEKIPLAVENHKDWRALELATLIKDINSPLIGVCLDTGNNVALLEHPWETMEVLAPYVITIHLKDMAVAEYRDGFLLSEVPLGTGFLDLPRMAAALRQSHPGIHFNLEMITREPLRVPCLKPKYWATLDALPGRRLAEMLDLVRSQAGKISLPTLRGLNHQEQLRREEENVRRCLVYARDQLKI